MNRLPVMLCRVGYQHLVFAFMYHISYTLIMANEGLWTTMKKQRENRIKEIRNDLIIKLARTRLGYEELSHGDVADIMNGTQASVSRLLKHGKNVSKVAGTEEKV